MEIPTMVPTPNTDLARVVQGVFRANIHVGIAQFRQKAAEAPEGSMDREIFTLAAKNLDDAMEATENA